jgi:dihydroxyacetone kinase
VETACRALLTSAAELNALDAKVGDGDTGSTFATGANAVLAQLDALPFDDARALCAAIAARLSNAMGGSSGILLSIGIAAMGASLGEPPDFPKALGEGVRRIQEYGGASVGDRTMLDALVPAIAALASGEGLAGAGHAARHGAELTATMTNARAGRSSYLSSASLVGVADPGASAVAAIFEALASM